MNTDIVNQSLNGFAMTLVLGLLLFAGYIIIGIAVLSLIERERRVAAVCAKINGIWAWVALVIWPLTVLWLLMILLQDRIDG